MYHCLKKLVKYKEYSDFPAHSMFTSDAEVGWALVSLGTQVQLQIILDPDYLPDHLSVLITMLLLTTTLLLANCFFYHLHINQTITLWTIVIIWGYFLIWTCLGLLNWVHVLIMLVDVFVIDERGLYTNANSTYFTVFYIIIYIIPLLTTAYSYEVSE